MPGAPVVVWSGTGIPEYIAGDINLVADCRRLLRSAADRTYVVPRTHNTFGDKTFAAAGPRVWNNMSSHDRVLATVSSDGN